MTPHTHKQNNQTNYTFSVMPQEILFMGCGMRIPYKNACAVCFSNGGDVSRHATSQ